MRSPGIDGEGELRGQPANPGSPGKMAVKTECVCVCVVSLEKVDKFCYLGNMLGADGGCDSAVTASQICLEKVL